MSKPARPGICAADWLLHLLRQLARCAIGDFERSSRWPAEGVHALRVRMKKLRALLPLGRGGGSDAALGQLSELCRGIKDSVAEDRDEQVLCRLCLELCNEPPPWPRTLSPPASNRRRLRQEIRALQAALARLQLPELTWKLLRDNHRRALKRVRKARQRCLGCCAADAFHAWRKRVKTVLFQSLALSCWKGAGRRIRQARKLGRQLGREHDLALLCGRLRHADEVWQGRARGIRAMRSKLQRKVRRAAL
jgi:hypothetical protein